MKGDLMNKKFETVPTIGTKATHEFRSFFGAFMLEIEDEILVDSGSIQYSHVVDTSEFSRRDGFQYIEYNPLETIFLRDLSVLKESYTTIGVASQNTVDLLNNTRWIIDIDVNNILRDYLFYKVKESRAFKCIHPDNILKRNMNVFVYDYIDKNVIGRYHFSDINLYIRYKDVVSDARIDAQAVLRYDPIFDKSVVTEGELVNNVNIANRQNIHSGDPIRVLYSQTKKATEYKFDYYFNLKYIRV